MQCNIDARGRAVRWNSGIVCCLIGLAVVGSAYWLPRRTMVLSIGAVLILSGLFQLFEARKGWCAVRAMGFKTPV